MGVPCIGVGEGHRATSGVGAPRDRHGCWEPVSAATGPGLPGVKGAVQSDVCGTMVSLILLVRLKCLGPSMQEERHGVGWLDYTL